jgi:hypothetical protein
MKIAPMHTIVSVSLLALLFAFSLAQSKEASPLPGEYITNGGWGVLTIYKPERQATKFSLNSFGANGHTCSLEGIVNSGQAELDIGEAGRVCKVQFRDTPQGVVVSAIDMDPCRNFCGTRAGFDGEYLAISPACTVRARRESKERFAALYKRKSYQQALVVLSPILTNCAKALDWFEIGRIRNDIAITQYHLGKLADCLTTLAPLTDRGRSESELQDELPPTDFTSYLPIARATWHNLSLCKK